MKPFSRLIFLAGGVLLAGWIYSGPDLGAQPQPDPDRTFKKADADGDGKLTREEWKKFNDGLSKLKSPFFKGGFKGAPKGGDTLFDRLDENNDGSLTIDEYRKVIDLRNKKGPDAQVEPKREAVAEKPATQEQVAFFEKSIRPVLVKECYECHAADSEQIKGGLLLDTRAALREGGNNGPAVVPGDPKKSLLIKALRHTEEERRMPPKKKLSEEVIADFEKWIAMGAPDPRDGSAKVI